MRYSNQGVTYLVFDFEEDDVKAEEVTFLVFDFEEAVTAAALAYMVRA